MRIRRLLFLGIGILVARADPPPAAPPAAPDDLYSAGKQLFDQYAPPEVKAQYDFPSKDQWDEFAVRLQRALDNNSLGDLAAYAPEARAALVTLRAVPGYEDYADWLALRLDEIEAAGQATAPSAQRAPGPAPILRTPSIPHYDLWLARLRDRPIPADAATLMPQLRTAFAAEGVPPELAWLAEAESSLNPSARSPSGARGLFQLTPETAKTEGLSTFLPDQRTDPTLSARAAARLLRTLYGRFGSWPLVLAGYNAGEGRVSHLMASRGAGDYAGVASALPSETRMYVPKVLALVAVRTGVDPDKLPPPRT
jgi:membrane-bound lytic murein transglycosylase D